MNPASPHHCNPDSPGKRLSDTPAVHVTASVSHSDLGRYCEIGARCTIAESQLGDYSYVGHDSDLIYMQAGKFCSIASHVRINPGNHPMQRAALHHFTYRASQYGFGEDEPAFFDWRRSHNVILGNDVWIGHGAIILPGVTIGDGAVVGAGAVVTHDLADFAIAVGVPARTHRFRFEESIRIRLKHLAWWNWSHERLRNALDDFRTLPIDAFCTRHESIG